MKTEEHKRMCRECFDRRDDLRENDCVGCEQNVENFDVVIKIGEAGVVFCAKMWK